MPCSTGHGTWFESASAWCARANPQPPQSDAVWNGSTDGAVYTCTRPGYGGIPDPSLTGAVWLPASAATPLPPPDPEELAWRAVAAVQLQPPTMGVFPRMLEEEPDQLGYVGWNKWLWVRDPGPQTWGPISSSASERGYTVTITAEVDSVEWDMGNGDVITCGKGTPWPSHATRNQASPDCGYMYEQMGTYTITATANWVVHWGGIGQTGVIDFPRSNSGTVEIGEIQVLNVPNPGR